MTKCYNCVHNFTCKYKDKFEKILADFKLSSPDSEFVEVECRCRFYSENSHSLYADTDWWHNYQIVQNINTINRANCETCDFYNQYFKLGKTYIGDSPCENCNSLHKPKTARK